MASIELNFVNLASIRFGEELHELVDFNRKRLSEASNLNILPLADELCSREPCLNNERCRNVLKFDGTGDFIVTENFIFKPVHCISTFICECPIGFAGKLSWLGNTNNLISKSAAYETESNYLSTALKLKKPLSGAVFPLTNAAIN
ncbi:hypothetical protein D917_02401 [Trichinella nativa]|uniref:Uncharacterized protein n=1 Tax=Trichinella nativa TaxID=6335 RepID=A0A1Y3EJ95_9BILA|nr:hypothetical protein D917_02401 [Trichinella nativa]